MRNHRMHVRISLVFAAAAALAAIAASTAGAARQSATLAGAGSTFVQPLVNTWTQLPSPAQSPYTTYSGNSVTYSGVGSGTGVADIANKSVDFGASDAPLSAFATTCTTCYQIPWALSGTAVIYHIDGVTSKTGGSTVLRMSGAVLAKIYMGQITNWSDQSIKAINKTLNIPSTPITTVHRDSASGTTYNFTDYLSSASKAFKTTVGTSVFPQWPGSNTQQAHGSSGMDAAVKNTNGAVGYVDVYYGVKANLTFMKIQNRAGHWVLPNGKSILAASKIQTHPASDGSLSIVNPPATAAYESAYPISTYTYVDVQKQSAQPAPLKNFLNWAVTTGQKYAAQDIFVPLPAPIVSYDKQQIAKITG